MIYIYIYIYIYHLFNLKSIPLINVYMPSIARLLLVGFTWTCQSNIIDYYYFFLFDFLKIKNK